MTYRNLGAFLTKVTLKAIEKLDAEDASSDECMRIAENVIAWAGSGTITEKQFDVLNAALPMVLEFPEDELEPEGAETVDEPLAGEGE